MSACDNCGAALTRSTNATAVCGYCGTTNAPLPREVPVPVPVQVVHNVVHVAGAAPANVELRCPQCGKRLVAVRAKQAELHGCSGCGGIWIDNASARRVLRSPDAVFDELASRAGQNAKRPGMRAARPTCPACPAVLDRLATHHVELDVCGDHGTWFDAFELSQLVRALRGEQVKARPAKPVDVRCAGCRKVISMEFANVSDEGLVCEPCWRGREAEIVSEGERRAYAEGSVTVGGALLGVAAVMLGAAAAGAGRNS